MFADVRIENSLVLMKPGRSILTQPVRELAAFAATIHSDGKGEVILLSPNLVQPHRVTL